jgi:hypothetical protein
MSVKSSYTATHLRLMKERGPARTLSCSHCPRKANHWAYDHKDPDARIDPKNGCLYSTDLAHYIPLCQRCHYAFDHPEYAHKLEMKRLADIFDLKA